MACHPLPFLPSFGMGLPISSAYSDYLGGSLQLHSMQVIIILMLQGHGGRQKKNHYVVLHLMDVYVLVSKGSHHGRQSVSVYTLSKGGGGSLL